MLMVGIVLGGGVGAMMVGRRRSRRGEGEKGRRDRRGDVEDWRDWKGIQWEGGK